jgi:hypothetical protein
LLLASPVLVGKNVVLRNYVFYVVRNKIYRREIYADLYSQPPVEPPMWSNPEECHDIEPSACPFGG